MSLSDSKKLRVVYVAGGYPSRQHPGLCIFIHRSIKTLSSQVDPLVIHLRAWKPNLSLVEKQLWDSVTVVRLGIPQFPTRKFLKLNIFMLSYFGYILGKPYLSGSDLVHSISVYPIGYITDQWTKALNKTHVTQAIGRDVNLDLSNASSEKARWLSTVEGISCNTVALQERIRSLAPDQQNMPVIHRGVDTLAFTPDGPQKGPQVGLPVVRFLYLGGFQTWNPKEYETINYKGGHILLEAWRQAETQLGSSSLIIGGSGVERSRLEGWRSSLSRPQNVHILSSIDPGDVPGFLRACNVVVLPSITDGLPNLANEAQACGRPVLGTDAGGIPETVVHGETGIIVGRNNPQTLSRGLVWFVEHQTKIPEMGIMARQRMVKYFDWEIYRKQTLTLYQVSLNCHNSR